MKRLMLLSVSAVLMGLAGFAPLLAGNKKETKKMNTNKKILVVYFSHSGNTRVTAGQAHELAGGDIFELVPVSPYPAEYSAVVAQAKKEIQAGFKPRLKAMPDVKKYDVIIVGTPNWWSTLAGPVTTFLAESDLAGKTVAPFITHGGGGLGHIPADVKKLCPKSVVLETLAVDGSEVKTARADVAAWLGRLGLLK